MQERLQKILSRFGVASRRAAEKLILQGRISVNGVRITELGAKANSSTDEIRLDGQRLHGDADQLYLLLNKPRGYVTTLHDPEGRPTVIDLLHDIHQRVYPVGRLDFDSEGALILTNDGDFAQKIAHPRYAIPKTYRVKINERLSGESLRLLAQGFSLSDGWFKPLWVREDKSNRATSWVSLAIQEGRNRLVRRAFAYIHHEVIRLIRTAIGDLTLHALSAGTYRHLTKGEIHRILETANRSES